MRKKISLSLDQVKTSLTNSFKLQSVGQTPMQQLELKFTPENKEADTNQLREILSKYLTYPSSQIAEVHLKANRLGCLDLDQKASSASSYEHKEHLLSERKTENLICPCCGFIEQDETLILKSSLADVNHIGISTYLYFLTIKSLSLLLMTMLIVYSCYSMVTNKMASDNYQYLSSTNSNGTVVGIKGSLYFSTRSKQLTNINNFSSATYNIQCWLGVAMVALWMIIFAFIKFWERKIQYEVDYDSQTASDYTLFFKNLPKDMTKQELQKQLQQYRLSLQGIYSHYAMFEPIKIAKINKVIPFYLDEKQFDDKDLKSIQKNYQNSKKQLIKLVESRRKEDVFDKSSEDRLKIYKQFNDSKTQKEQKITEIMQRIRKEKMSESRSNQDLQPAFVTFSCIYNKQFLQKANDTSIFYLYRCFQQSHPYFYYNSQDSSKIQASIGPAHQPEDILWTNLGQGQCQSYKRKLLTFAVTAVLLSISFMISYIFSYLQLQQSKKNMNPETKNFINNVYSQLISLSLSIINMIINQCVYRLTRIERNPNYIAQQTSLGIKAVIATLINSILNPILVNKFLKTDLEGQNGLADDVYNIALTSALLSPVYKIFDTNVIISKLTQMYYNRPSQKLSLNQKQLNSKFQYQQFSIGYQYIHIVNLFNFTCFFVSLQPVIVLFTIGGFFLMFWVQKYSLFNRCRRPTPGNNSVNTGMYQLIFMGPMMYSIGSIFWSDTLNKEQSGTVPNIVAIIISGVILLLPYKLVLKKIVAQQVEENLQYQDNRLFLPSEYDRLNPFTSQKGIKDYLEYIARQKNSMQAKTPEQLQRIEQIFNRQNGVGYRHRRNLLPQIGNFIGMQNNLSQQITQNIGGLSHNCVNPLLIGEFLKGEINEGQKRKSGQEVKYNVVVQNWLTQQQSKNSNKNIESKINLYLNNQLGGNDNRRSSLRKSKENDGDLNISYNDIIKRSSPQINVSQDVNTIPMNLPINLFGTMLSSLDKNNNLQENHFDSWRNRQKKQE